MNIKARIVFGYGVSSELISHECFRPSQLAHTYGRMHPHIHGDATWSKDMFGRSVMQIVYDSSDETKLLRIINKYGGRFIDVDNKLKQRQITEHNNTVTGKKDNTELADEIIQGDWN